VAQTGDPLGTGKGGESVFRLLYGDQATYFEMESKPRIKHSKLGQVSMVNNGSNMHGSQFFITLAPNIDYLDGKHTVFGEVAEGFDVLEKLNEVYVDKDSRPYKDIRIYHTVVVDDPFDDPPGLENHIPDQSPVLTREQLDSVRIGAEEEIDDTKGMKPEEVEERIREREAKAHAQILEMVGDLPEADARPPDNVLFVCKLNPVTTEEDLEVIFSRFGKILSCEVIKDQKTGNSLQYAFIEFENPSDCENAYFKMDNVLIDERRIHVDFSQSVAKLKWKGKGKGVEQVTQDRDEGPRLRIKNPDARRDDKYDFVFDDDDANDQATATKHAKHSKKLSKKHAKEHHSRSESGDEASGYKSHHRHHSETDDKSKRQYSDRTKHDRSEATSSIQKRKHRHHSRSRSPQNRDADGRSKQVQHHHHSESRRHDDGIDRRSHRHKEHHSRRDNRQ
jgi:peptidyl-prolyl cis-trans isomerase-like 4